MTIFSKIAAGEIPSYKIASDDKHYAFLDINPVVKGHVLVIPRIEDDYIFNLADADLASLTLFAKKVAKAIEKVVPCKRVAVAVLGMEVPHVHIHLLPINSEADINFKNKQDIPADEMKALAEAINAEFEKS